MATAANACSWVRRSEARRPHGASLANSPTCWAPEMPPALEVTAEVSGQQVTIRRGAAAVLGVDLESGTVGHWPDGETWVPLVDLPPRLPPGAALTPDVLRDRKSTRLNSSHVRISYDVFCLKKTKMRNSIFLDYIKTDEQRSTHRSPS